MLSPSFSTVGQPDVQKVLSDVKMDIRQSGFSAPVFRDAIPVDRYCIGLLFTDKTGSQTFLLNTGNVLERTPNVMRLIQGQADPACEL